MSKILIQRDDLSVVIGVGDTVTMTNGLTATITKIDADPVWPVMGIHVDSGKMLSWTREGRIWSDQTPDRSDIDLIKMNTRTVSDIARDLAASLAEAVDLLREHVSVDALGYNSDGDLQTPGLSRTWPILNERIWSMMTALEDAKQAGLIEKIPDASSSS